MLLHSSWLEMEYALPLYELWKLSNLQLFSSYSCPGLKFSQLNSQAMTQREFLCRFWRNFSLKAPLLWYSAFWIKLSLLSWIWILFSSHDKSAMPRLVFPTHAAPGKVSIQKPEIIMGLVSFPSLRMHSSVLAIVQYLNMMCHILCPMVWLFTERKQV